MTSMVEPVFPQLQVLRQQIQKLQQQLEALLTQPQWEMLLEVRQAINVAFEDLERSGQAFYQHYQTLALSYQVLEAAKQRYQDLFESSPDGYLITDTNGNIQAANFAIARLLNTSPQELIHRSIRDFLPVTTQQTWFNLLQQLQQSGQIHDWEMLLNPNQRNSLNVSAAVTMVQNTTDGATELRWSIRDITERKQIEATLQQRNVELNISVDQQSAQLSQTHAQLRQSEARFFNLVANVPGMIYQFLPCVDSAHSLPYVSSGCRDIFELEPAAIQENANLLWAQVHPEDLPKLQESIAIAVQATTAWHGEFRIITPSAQVKWIQGSSLPEPLDNGLCAWDGVMIDITERKQAELEIRKALDAERKLSQLKDDFLSTVSHELRTPVSNMKLALKMLSLSPLDRQQRYLDILEAECHREVKLINDLLDLQQLEANTMLLENALVQLQDWLPPLLAPFASLLQEREQQLTLFVEPSLPPLQTDGSALARIITELVTNASKHNRAGIAIDVQARLTDLGTSIWVSNSGAEIPVDEQDKIFEKFYRIPTQDPWIQGGMGLGLALVKKLVNRLGGSITVQSGAGQTRFWILFPG